jgi:hypothetical protein
MPVVEHFAGQNKLVRVAGQGSIDSVYAHITQAVEPLFRAELLRLNRALLQALAARDWARYSALCDDSMTYVGPDTRQHLITGLDQQSSYFNSQYRVNGFNLYGAESTMIDVRLN